VTRTECPSKASNSENVQLNNNNLLEMPTVGKTNPLQKGHMASDCHTARSFH